MSSLADVAAGAGKLKWANDGGVWGQGNWSRVPREGGNLKGQTRFVCTELPLPLLWLLLLFVCVNELRNN